MEERFIDYWYCEYCEKDTPHQDKQCLTCGKLRGESLEEFEKGIEDEG